MFFFNWALWAEVNGFFIAHVLSDGRMHCTDVFLHVPALHNNLSTVGTLLLLVNIWPLLTFWLDIACVDIILLILVVHVKDNIVLLLQKEFIERNFPTLWTKNLKNRNFWQNCYLQTAQRARCKTVFYSMHIVYCAIHFQIFRRWNLRICDLYAFFNPNS